MLQLWVLRTGHSMEEGSCKRMAFEEENTYEKNILRYACNRIFHCLPVCQWLS